MKYIIWIVVWVVGGIIGQQFLGAGGVLLGSAVGAYIGGRVLDVMAKDGEQDHRTSR